MILEVLALYCCKEEWFGCFFFLTVSSIKTGLFKVERLSCNLYPLSQDTYSFNLFFAKITQDGRVPLGFYNVIEPKSYWIGLFFYCNYLECFCVWMNHFPSNLNIPYNFKWLVNLIKFYCSNQTYSLWQNKFLCR